MLWVVAPCVPDILDTYIFGNTCTSDIFSALLIPVAPWILASLTFWCPRTASQPQQPWTVSQR